MAMPAIESVVPAPPERSLSLGRSLTAKAMLLLVFVAAAPAVTVALLLAGANRDAIETSERQLQAAVLAEISGSSMHALDAITEDAQAIAAALSFAAEDPEGVSKGLASVKALLS